MPALRRDADYHHERLGCEVWFRYLMVKLIDLDEAQLEATPNPIAALVLAHLKTQRWRSSPEALYREKLRLVRRLLEGGYTKRYIVDLYREVDYLMALPKELEREVKLVVKQIQRERGLKRLSFIEREALEEGARQGLEQGRKEGLEQGMQQGRLATVRENLLVVLRVRFGAVPEEVVRVVESEARLERLQAWFQVALTVPDIDTFRQQLTES